MTQTSLPAARAAFIDQSGRPTPEFYRFLETLATAQAGNVSPDEITAINAQLAELQAEIAALPSAEIPKLQVTYPILSQGLLQNGFAKLALNQPGDSGAGALKGITLDAWGRVTGTTDATITGTAGRVTVTNGNAAAGVPTIDLAPVANAGGGSLLKIVRDAWGRITGTSTPTTTDLAEGSNLYFTAARVLATVLAGLSTATNAVIAAADTVLSALGKLQAQISAIAIPQGYIDGLQMHWVSATALTVSSGAAYIPSLGNILQATSSIAKTGLVLSASTWYHVYLFDNAGTPDVEIVTTAPASPYNGTARTKTGDTSRRYVGSVKTDASGSILSFLHANNRVRYKSVGASFRVLAAGTATTSTNVPCSAYIPVTGVVAILMLQNTGAAATAAYLTPGDTTPQSITSVVLVRGMSSSTGSDSCECPLDSAQSLNYVCASGASVYVDISGYEFTR